MTCLFFSCMPWPHCSLSVKETLLAVHALKKTKFAVWPHRTTMEYGKLNYAAHFVLVAELRPGHALNNKMLDSNRNPQFWSKCNHLWWTASFKDRSLKKNSCNHSKLSTQHLWNTHHYDMLQALIFRALALGHQVKRSSGVRGSNVIRGSRGVRGTGVGVLSVRGTGALPYVLILSLNNSSLALKIICGQRHVNHTQITNVLLMRWWGLRLWRTRNKVKELALQG